MVAPVQGNHGIAALVIGILEIVFATIIMVCSFEVGAKVNGHSSITPYWAGIPYLIPGIFGIVAGITKNVFAMVAFMVLNIICFIVDGVAAILLFLSIGLWQDVASEVTKSCKNYNTYGKKTCVCVVDGIHRTYDVEDCDTLKSIVGLLLVIIIFAVIAALTSLAGSILGCISICSRGTPVHHTVIVQSQVQEQPTGYVIQKQ